MDERYSPRIYNAVKPDFIVVTNLFRDSLTRNAHPGYIADILTESFPKTAKLILNADDIISAGVAPENPRVYFGIDHLPGDTDRCVNLVNDAILCPRCGAPLHYDLVRYHHIGRAACPHCGYATPQADYLATQVDPESRTMVLEEKGQGYPYHLVADSPHNIYNMVTVIAALRELGYDHGTIARHMETAQILATRLSEEVIGDCTVVIQMAKEKNALANSRNFDAIRKAPGRKEILLMMNCLNLLKDWSENPSWMYDADFEFLNQEDGGCPGGSPPPPGPGSSGPGNRRSGARRRGCRSPGREAQFSRSCASFSSICASRAFTWKLRATLSTPWRM